jgi:hypothetical protein
MAETDVKTGGQPEAARKQVLESPIKPDSLPGTDEHISQHVSEWFRYGLNITTTRAHHFAAPNEKLERLVKKQPNEQSCNDARSAALTYLEEPLVPASEVNYNKAELFAAMSWLYPDNFISQLAMIKAFIQSAHEDGPRIGITYLKRLSSQAKFPASILESISSSVLPPLEERFSKLSFSALVKSCHLMKFEWNAPHIFRNRRELCIDLPQFLVLTQVFAVEGSGQTAPRQNFFRADKIIEFVREAWGSQGENIFESFHQALLGLLADPERIHIQRCTFPQMSMIATLNSISVVAVSVSREWEDIQRCLFWIDGVLGSSSDGLWCRRLGPPTNDRTVGSTDLDRHQMDEMDRLISQHLGQSQTRLTRGLLSKSTSQSGKRPKRSTVKAVRATTHVHLKAQNIVNWSGVDRFKYEAEYAVTVPRQECWTALIEKGFLSSFPLPFSISNLYVGKGLRISFDHMCALAAIERTVAGPDGGLILAGHSVALVPIRIVNEREKSIQWHCHIWKNTGERFRNVHNRPGFWESLPTPRLCEPSIENLKGIAYIGWAESFEYQLGTKPAPHVPQVSTLPATAHVWQLKEKSLSLGVQFSLPQVVAITPQVQQTYEKVALTPRFSPSSELDLRFKGMFSNSVIIYDAQSKVAWLCPLILLMVHMLRLYLTDMGYQSNIDAIQFPIVSIKKQIQLHLQALVDLKFVPIIGSASYGTVFTMLANVYDEAFGNLDRVEANQKQLLGFELNHLFRGSGTRVSPKRLKTDGSIRKWSVIARCTDILFCEGLGDALCASSGERQNLCNSAGTVITGQNILVCPLYLLRELLETNSWRFVLDDGGQQGGQWVLSAEKEGQVRYRWAMSGSPFACLSHTMSAVACDELQCWTRRIQQVASSRTVLPRNSRIQRFLSPKRPQCQLPKPALKKVIRQGVICFGKISKRALNGAIDSPDYSSDSLDDDRSQA